MSESLSTDVLIVGGGVAGLWLNARLRRLGYSTLLVDKGVLGGGQSVKSQGIIHGGTKYALSGALTGASEAIADMPEHWKACLAVNLDGAFLACRWAAQRMGGQGAGAIIMTASTSGLYGVPTRSPYVAAKWGVIGMMKTLAMELGPMGVRVNAICPGAVEGPRMDRVVSAEARARDMTEEAVRALYAEGTSMRRWITAEDVAETALFLASPAARHVSGQAIAVDGHTERMT